MKLYRMWLKSERGHGHGQTEWQLFGTVERKYPSTRPSLEIQELIHTYGIFEAQNISMDFEQEKRFNELSASKIHWSNRFFLIVFFFFFFFFFFFCIYMDAQCRNFYFLCQQFYVLLVTKLYSFRKHAYSNILKILSPKKWKFSDKKFCYFSHSTQNIDCGYSLEPPRWGGSNEYPQSMFFEQK